MWIRGGRVAAATLTDLYSATVGAIGAMLIPGVFLFVALIIGSLRWIAPWLHTVPKNPLGALLDTLVTAGANDVNGVRFLIAQPDALMDEARGLARQLATQPTRGLGLIKRAMNASAANSLEQQLELEAVLQAEAASTADFDEGVAAFMEKRPPAFTGR